jgi:hypothetical protein
MNHKQSVIGGVIAFVLATSCCWLPALAVLLGGATGILSLSAGLEKYSGLLMAIGFGLLAFGAYQYYAKQKKQDTVEVQLQSTITCSKCGHQKEETMPTNACQFFYDCENCKEVLKPNKGDCCVYCSFGTVKCPPIQLGEDCC